MVFYLNNLISVTIGQSEGNMITVGQFFTIELRSLYAGQNIITRLGYVVESYDGTDDLLDVVKDMVAQTILPEITSMQVDSYRYTTGKIINRGGEVLDEFTVNASGLIANAVGLPPHDVAYIVFRNSGGGRSSSRLGVSGIPALVQDEGLFTATALDNYGGVANAVMTVTRTTPYNLVMRRAFGVGVAEDFLIVDKNKVMPSVRTLDSRRVGDGI